MAEFWDAHSVADHWDQTRPAEFEVDLKTSRVMIPLESKLAKKLQRAAVKRGMSAEALLGNLVREHLS